MRLKRLKFNNTYFSFSGLKSHISTLYLFRSNPCLCAFVSSADGSPGRLLLWRGKHRRLQQLQDLPSNQEADGERLLQILQSKSCTVNTAPPSLHDADSFSVKSHGSINWTGRTCFWNIVKYFNFSNSNPSLETVREICFSEYFN